MIVVFNALLSHNFRFSNYTNFLLLIWCPRRIFGMAQMHMCYVTAFTNARIQNSLRRTLSLYDSSRILTNLPTHLLSLLQLIAIVQEVRRSSHLVKCQPQESLYQIHDNVLERQPVTTSFSLSFNSCHTEYMF